ncbi:MAG: fused MFS/spermidine synthase [Gammaproteobacteria bacterium]|nr:fused MFS/spermidine synthase [Gammaproteobacteria bacterium]
MSTNAAERHGRVRILPLALLYAGSGVTSLSLEVLWARMLSLQFGVSIFGVVVTVMAFMGGLGLGSLLGARWQRYRLRPLQIFALLEGGIALYALALPSLLAFTGGRLDAIASSVGLGGWYLLQGGALFFLILVPATAMGLGFPLVLRAVAGEPRALGRLYGANACGAAVGAVLPLWLLPAYGWGDSVYIVAAIGLFVALGALGLNRVLVAEGAGGGANVIAPGRSIPRMTLLLYGGLGAAAIILEVGWTRLFGMVLMRTEYVLAIILAVYLCGIGLGSLLARYMAGRHWFTVLPLAAASFTLAGLGLLPGVSAWLETQTFATLGSALLGEAALLAALTFPVTLALGAWLPLLNARFGAGPLYGAVLYGVNSVGAALGALLAGFVLIPAVGSTMTVALAGILLFVSGMTWSMHRRAWLALLPLLALAVPAGEFPPLHRMLPGVYAGSQDLYRYEDAVTITHVVGQADGQRILLTDLQRMDASTEPAAVELQKNQARLPLLLHPAPGSVLFLGLGTGISAAGSLPYPALERTAVELSLGAITAARDWFAPVNGGVSERMTVVRDDARRFLRVSARGYDVVIGDVFHPDLAGRSALLSVQQFERARARLNPGGVFVQWLALNQFDLESLRIVLRTFRHVFPGGVLFMDGFRLALVGFEGDTVLAIPASAEDDGSLDANDATGGEGAWTWLGRYWGRIPPSEGALQDEWRPVIEYRLPLERYRTEPVLVDVLQWLLQRRPSVEQAAAELGVTAGDFSALERPYIAADLGLRGWLATLRGQDAEAIRLIRYAYQANPRDRWISYSLADEMYAALSRSSASMEDRRRALQAILGIRPDHAEALRALWRIEAQAGDQSLAGVYRDRLRAVSPLDHDLAAELAEQGSAWPAPRPTE